MTRDHTSIQELPDEPGVYFFMGSQRQVLYVGKATSLRDRVRSYFAKDLVRTRGQHIVNMVSEAVRVDHRTTDSVLEALILEAKLIKEIKPLYNTRDKDDKSFNYLVLTTHETYPRFLTVRGKDMHHVMSTLGAKGKLPVYGPFPHAGQFTAALKIIRNIFPYYDTKHPVETLREKNDHRLRFNESIGIYPPAGTTQRDYARTVRHIRLFFDGKKVQLVRKLERDMHRFAKSERFEEAAEAKRQLYALQHINDMSLIRRNDTGDTHGTAVRVEGYDVAHLGGKDMVGVMTVVEHGEVAKAEYRSFTIKSVDKSNDTKALGEMLQRRLAHTEWRYPRLIVVDGGKAQLNVARKVLREAGIQIPVLAVTKDERHRPKQIQGPVKLRSAHQTEILLVNAEAHRFSLAMHKKKRAKRLGK